ncbi:ABC transporter ATP-binding protein [Thalassospira alkalitolerans]|uniref:ABC transporter ATP-binding protein n=1 Tax=Thalassospira alkalitolerans TaxID=1293890 RepID=UPI0030EE5AB0|tara:strand:- start:49291 stop:51036 length:1746 start_codon:yes stop_codon:yes gene_type:complete
MYKNIAPIFGAAWQAFSLFYNQYPIRFLLVFLIMLVSGVLEGVSFLSFVPVLDVLGGVAESGGSKISLTFLEYMSAVGLPASISAVLSVLVCLMIFRSLLLAVGTVFVQWTFADYVASLRVGLIESAMNAQWSAVRDQKTGEVVNAALTEVEAASATAQQMNQALVSLIQILVYMGAAIAISWQFTAASMVGAAIMMLLLSFLILMARAESIKKTSTTKEYASLIADWMQNQKALKVMGIGHAAIKLIVEATEKLSHSVKKLAVFQSSLVLGQEVLILFFLAGAILLVDSYLQIEVSELLVGIVLLQRLMSKFGAFQIAVNAIARQQAGFISVRQRLDDLQHLAEFSSVRKEAKPRVFLSSNIDFRNVSFSYAETLVLADVNLKINAGEMVALVGASGAGKSTLLDMVTGLVNPIEGEVRVDDIPLSSLDLVTWRGQIGYVPQDVVLMHDTIRENLTLGAVGLSDQDVFDALKLAGAYDFINERKEGLDLIVGERGQTLSGGQRQRLALARALIRKPRFLILDEATSALDQKTELEIAETLRSLTPGITILMTSHRPALSSLADRIVSMEKGAIIPSVPVT